MALRNEECGMVNSGVKPILFHLIDGNLRIQPGNRPSSKTPRGKLRAATRQSTIQPAKQCQTAAADPESLAKGD